MENHSVGYRFHVVDPAPRVTPPLAPVAEEIAANRAAQEVFAGDSVVLTERIYPQRPDSEFVRLTAAGAR